mgnify:CR=1 FL=1
MEENEIAQKTEGEEGLYFGDYIKLDILAVDFLKGAKKLWYLAVLIVAALSLLSFYNCKKNYVPKYVSQASFSISTLGSNSSATGASSISSYYNSALAEQLSKTFSYIINSSAMRQILLDRLGINGLNGTISASNDVANTPLFTITVTSTSPSDAYNILCAVIENYPRLAQHVLGETEMSVYSPAQYPEKPSNEFTYKKDVLLSAVLGAFTSCLIFAVYAFSKNTVKRKSDIKEKLNQKCLAEIPWVSIKKRKRKTPSFITISQKNADFSESFRYLKRRVAKRVDSPSKKVIAVTSTVSGEGKTTVSYNLALSLAQSGKKVALLDADFLRMSLQKYLGASELIIGAADYLCGECSIERIVAKSENENLFVYYAGSKKLKSIPKEPLERLFANLRESYDYVVVDTAPCGIVSDAAQIIAMSDETLFVIKQDHAAVSKIRRVLQYIYDLNADVLGVVFNAVRPGFSGYKTDGYSYGYGGKYGYYEKRYGCYGGYDYSGYGSKGRKHGRGDYGYYGSYGYSSGGRRVDENIKAKKENEHE